MLINKWGGHCNSGCRYYTTGQYNTGDKYDLAIIEFTKAIEINPRYAQAYNIGDEIWLPGLRRKPLVQWPKWRKV